jgi:hypothetical protein
MDFLHFLPFVSTAVTVVFAASVLSRFAKGRRLYTLFWGVGLLLYAAGTLSEAVLALGWSDVWLRVWYLSGAMLTAAWLGQGTVYLLVRRQAVAHGLMIALAVASLIAIIAVFTAPVDASAFKLGLAVSSQYKAILTRTGLMILLTILLNIYGSLTLIGGALLSVWLFYRKAVLSNRMLGNAFIAAGALLPASAGTLIKLGLGDWLYVSELAGAAVMFLGFWLATQPQPNEQTAPAPAAA